MRIYIYKVNDLFRVYNNTGNTKLPLSSMGMKFNTKNLKGELPEEPTFSNETPIENSNKDKLIGLIQKTYPKCIIMDET